MKKLPKVDTKVVVIGYNEHTVHDLHFTNIVGRVVAVPKDINYSGILVKFKPEDLTEEANKWTHNGFDIAREAEHYNFSKKFDSNFSLYRFFPLHALKKFKKTK